MYLTLHFICKMSQMSIMSAQMQCKIFMYGQCINSIYLAKTSHKYCQEDYKICQEMYFQSIKCINQLYSIKNKIIQRQSFTIWVVYIEQLQISCPLRLKVKAMIIKLTNNKMTKSISKIKHIIKSTNYKKVQSKMKMYILKETTN